MANSQEYPPLLPAGFHPMSLEQIRELCIVPFEGMSSTRSPIMFGLVAVIGRLEYTEVKGEIWIDGSFITQKIDPSDVDILLHIKAEFYDNASTEQRDAIDWVNSNLKITHRCDSYVWMEDEHNPENEWWRAYWIRQFGFSRDAADLKGMALYVLPAGGP